MTAADLSLTWTKMIPAALRDWGCEPLHSDRVVLASDYSSAANKDQVFSFLVLDDESASGFLKAQKQFREKISEEMKYERTKSPPDHKHLAFMSIAELICGRLVTVYVPSSIVSKIPTPSEITGYVARGILSHSWKPLGLWRAWAVVAIAESLISNFTQPKALIRWLSDWLSVKGGGTLTKFKCRRHWRLPT